jgi:hypothetical protein
VARWLIVLEEEIEADTHVNATKEFFWRIHQGFKDALRGGRSLESIIGKVKYRKVGGVKMKEAHGSDGRFGAQDALVRELESTIDAAAETTDEQEFERRARAADEVIERIRVRLLRRLRCGCGAVGRVPPRRDTVRIEVYQEDWIAGFAAFHEDGSLDESAKAHVVLNLASFLASVELGDVKAADLPYIIAESIMHEVVHVLEAWANVEFSEERVEALLTQYRARYGREGEAKYEKCEARERKLEDEAFGR